MTIETGRTRILLLGASGKLGRMIRAKWTESVGEGSEIVPIFRRTGQEEGLVWQPGQATGALPPVDAVVALWGVVRGDDAALSGNAVLGVEAARLGQALGARRVLHCSSAAVYGPGPEPFREADTPEPANAYGRAKLEMEQSIASLGLPGQVFMRIGNVAGAESLFGNMRPGGTVRLDQFPDGTAPRRSYIAPQALARVIAALIDPAAPEGAINVAAPIPTGMDALARAGGCHIDWQEAPETAMPLLALNTGRLSSICPLNESEADAAYLVAQAKATGCWP